MTVERATEPGATDVAFLVVAADLDGAADRIAAAMPNEVEEQR